MQCALHHWSHDLIKMLCSFADSRNKSFHYQRWKLKHFCSEFLKLNKYTKVQHPYQFTNEEAYTDISQYKQDTCSQQRSEVPERFKHQTEMLFVVKVSEETQTVKFIIRICIVQLLQKLKLFQSCLLPASTHKQQIKIELILNNFLTWVQ